MKFARARAGFFEYSMANPYGYDLGAIYNAMSGAIGGHGDHLVNLRVTSAFFIGNLMGFPWFRGSPILGNHQIGKDTLQIHA